MYKALIVDDEPLVREYLVENLSNIHSKWLASACAANGRKAIELLQDEKFDAVITDIRMPDMDGLELARHINERWEDTFIIILSGYDEFDYARQAVRLKAIDYLLKPINDDELHDVLDRIASLIGKRRGNLADAGSAKISADNVSQLFRDYLSTVADMSGEEPASLVDRAVEYLYAHFCEPISLSDVADALNVTPTYLSNVFHSVKGETYSNFLLRLRMERAALLLDTCPNIKVYTIAEKVGYASSKHFISVFKKYFGITPNEYRENICRKSASYRHIQEQNP